MDRQTQSNFNYCKEYCTGADECAYAKGVLPNMCGDAAQYYRLAAYENTGLTPEEIRPRWFPASTPPKVDGTYLVTMDGALCGEDKPFTGMCGYEDGKWDEDGYVLAWRDMPEPWVSEPRHKP